MLGAITAKQGKLFAGRRDQNPVLAFASHAWLFVVGLVGAGAWSAAVLAADAEPRAPVVIDTASLAQEPATRVAKAARALLADYWLPREQLSAAAQRRLPDWCEGGYVKVAQPYSTNIDPGTLPIEAQSNSARYLINKRLELKGDVEIERGNRRVRTDSAKLFEDSERAELLGNVRLEEPGLVLLGDSADIDLSTESARLDDVTYLLTGAGFRGNASAITQTDGGDLTISRGSVTRCDPGSNTWRIDSKRIEIADGAVFGTARKAVVRIKDVPVFYLPYMRFPVSDARQSGWLFPDIGFSGQDGFQLSSPYYFNIAPNTDATVSPRLLTKRGLSLEGEVRHLNRYGNYELGGAFLGKDRLFNGLLDRDDFEDANPLGKFERADRWLLAAEHRGGIVGSLGRLDTTIDYTAVSDPDYFRDLSTGLSVTSQVELERRAAVRYRIGNKNGVLGALDTQLWAQRFQRLDELNTDAYQRLPQLDLSYARKLAGPLQFSVASQAVSFDRDNDALSGNAAIVGDRYHVQPELRLPLQWPFAFAEITGGVRYTAYDLRDVPVGVDAKPTRSIGYASADGGLFFERSISLFGRPLVQTLEPRLYYLYQERAEQDELPRFDVSSLRFSYSQLFRRNRFSGLDRVSDANQFSAGLSSAFVDMKTGREYMRASIGQIFYLRDRTVTSGGAQNDDDRHSSSAIAAEFKASLTRDWSSAATVVWDPHDNTVDESLYRVSYRRSNRRIANIGYRQDRATKIDQTDVSLLWSVSKRWSVLGRWNYDIKNNRTIEGFAGLEYNDCCWQMRLIARRYIENRSAALIEQVEPDKGVFLQFVFKGLAGFGAKIDTLIQNGIRGYRTNDSNRF